MVFITFMIWLGILSAIFWNGAEFKVGTILSFKINALSKVFKE